MGRGFRSADGPRPQIGSGSADIRVRNLHTSDGGALATVIQAELVISSDVIKAALEQVQHCPACAHNS